MTTPKSGPHLPPFRDYYDRDAVATALAAAEREGLRGISQTDLDVLGELTLRLCWDITDIKIERRKQPVVDTI